MAEEKVACLAYHDALTELPNRALLEERLEYALARARRGKTSLALLFIHLDNFKLINDRPRARRRRRAATAGRVAHGASDASLRPAARLGGDESLLLVADIADEPARQAEAAADRIRTAIEKPFELAGGEFRVGLSVGASIFPEDAAGARDLLGHADVALYHAKVQGETASRSTRGATRSLAAARAHDASSPSPRA